MSSSIGRSNNAAFFWALRYSRLRKRPPGRHRRHRHHPSLLLFSLPFLVVVAFSPFKEDFVCVCEYNASDKLLMNTQALKTFSTPKKRWIKKITINPKPYTHKCSVSYPISHKKKMKGWDSSSKLSSSSSLSLGKKRKFLCRSTH